MRPLAIGLVLALGAAPAAAGDVDFSVRFGVQAGGASGQFGGFAQAGSTPFPHTRPPMPATNTPMPHTKPPGAAALERGRTPERTLPEPPAKPQHPHKRPRQRPFFFFDDDDDEERIVVVPAPRPEPPPPAPAVAEPPPPPDPQGPEMLKARGAPADEPFPVGEPLPEGVPHVTLDWRQYGLPRPPAGLIYARVRGEVLLIDPATRVVTRRVDPATLDAAGEAGGSG